MRPANRPADHYAWALLALQALVAVVFVVKVIGPLLGEPL